MFVQFVKFSEFCWNTKLFKLTFKPYKNITTNLNITKNVNKTENIYHKKSYFKVIYLDLYYIHIN